MAERQWKEFNEECYLLRDLVKTLAVSVKEMMQHPAANSGPSSTATGIDAGEMKANIMLAYRHLEDVAMRLGKAIQAWDGGTSVYPR